MQRPVGVETLEVVVSQLKQPLTISTLTPATLLDPQFSLSVGGDCLERWSEDTVSRAGVGRGVRLIGSWGGAQKQTVHPPEDPGRQAGGKNQIGYAHTATEVV